jgi:hypothetical protein
MYACIYVCTCVFVCVCVYVCTCIAIPGCYVRLVLKYLTVGSEISTDYCPAVTAAAPTSFDRLLRVMVIRKDGKVGARTVGPPAWPKLLKQIQMLPQQDQYGTP